MKKQVRWPVLVGAAIGSLALNAAVLMVGLRGRVEPPPTGPAMEPAVRFLVEEPPPPRRYLRPMEPKPGRSGGPVQTELPDIRVGTRGVSLPDLSLSPEAPVLGLDLLPERVGTQDGRGPGPGGPVFTEAQVDHPPRVLFRVRPRYPAAAAEAGIQGRVELLVLVDEAGRVEDVRVEAGPEELRRAALDAVEAWRFTPGRRAGRAVKVWCRQVIGFTLRD